MTTMENTKVEENLALVRKFFECYGAGDLDAMRQVLADDVVWHIPGRHPLSGTHRGVEEIVTFFQQLALSNFRAEVLYLGADDNYVVDVHRGFSNRGDGTDIDMTWVLVYQIKDGRIAEVRNFAANTADADNFFFQHYPLGSIAQRFTAS